MIVSRCSNNVIKTLAPISLLSSRMADLLDNFSLHGGKMSAVPGLYPILLTTTQEKECFPSIASTKVPGWSPYLP